MQIGAPPETIKDTMPLPRSVPETYVLPVWMFNWQKGINLSALEFPIYYNYFFRRRRTRIVGTGPQLARLASALREAVFGPRERHLRLDEDFGGACATAPDLRREMEHFRGTIGFSDLVTPGVLTGGRWSDGALEVALVGGERYEIRHAGRRLAVVPAAIEYEAQFLRGHRLPEPFEPPLFGVTCLGSSHGFDPTQNTSGFVIWLNHSGIMVDPPVDRKGVG